LSIKTGLSVGGMTFFISLIVLCLWILLKQIPGLGTLLNVLIIAVVIDITTFYFNPPTSIYSQYLLTIIAVLLVGLGSGIYLVANLGPGPRDGLMTGLTKISGYPISLVRASLEITVVLVGWYFGGTVGFGTLIFAFGIGPAVSLSLYIVNKI